MSDLQAFQVCSQHARSIYHVDKPTGNLGNNNIMKVAAILKEFIVTITHSF